jgi:hypothetical protein
LNESDKIKELLLKYREIFAEHDLDLGCLKGVQHKINTGNASPAKQKMRRTPYGFEKEEESHLQKLMNAGVIQPSSSDLASTPVLVRKKDGSVRLPEAQQKNEYGC